MLVDSNDGVNGFNYNLIYTPGISQNINGTDSFFHTDWLGSTRYLSTSTGNSFPSALRYTAFGEVSSPQGSGPPSYYQFAGGWGYQSEWSSSAEPGLGLQYLEQRYYDPSIGRFLSQDPIDFAGGINLYTYGENDPVNTADPEGRISRQQVGRALRGAGRKALGAVSYAADTPGRVLQWLRKRYFSVTLAPGTPTLQNANEEAYPGLRAGGREICEFVDREERDWYNQAFYGAVALAGAHGSADWLDYHEGVGGHVLARHVAKTDAELMARLAAAPYLKEASSFFTKEIAGAVISQTIKGNRAGITVWLRNTAVNADLPLTLYGTTPIGRLVKQGATVGSDATNAFVLLRKLGGGRYYVHTAYVF